MYERLKEAYRSKLHGIANKGNDKANGFRNVEHPNIKRMFGTHEP